MPALLPCGGKFKQMENNELDKMRGRAHRDALIKVSVIALIITFSLVVIVTFLYAWITDNL